MSEWRKLCHWEVPSVYSTLKLKLCLFSGLPLHPDMHVKSDSASSCLASLCASSSCPSKREHLETWTSWTRPFTRLRKVTAFSLWLTTWYGPSLRGAKVFRRLLFSICWKTRSPGWNRFCGFCAFWTVFDLIKSFRWLRYVCLTVTCYDFAELLSSTISKEDS